MLDDANGKDGDEWYLQVSTSMMDADEGAWKIKDHCVLENTGDGGLSSWLREIAGERTRTWNRRATKDPEVAETGEYSHVYLR